MDSSQSLAIGSQSVDFTDQFTYLGGVVHGSGSSEADVNRRLGLAAGAMASLTKGVWRCMQVSVQKDQASGFQGTGAAYLTLWL